MFKGCEFVSAVVEVMGFRCIGQVVVFFRLNIVWVGSGGRSAFCRFFCFRIGANFATDINVTKNLCIRTKIGNMGKFDSF